MVHGGWWQGREKNHGGRCRIGSGFILQNCHVGYDARVTVGYGRVGYGTAGKGWGKTGRARQGKKAYPHQVSDNGFRALGMCISGAFFSWC